MPAGVKRGWARAQQTPRWHGRPRTGLWDSVCVASSHCTAPAIAVAATMVDLVGSLNAFMQAQYADLPGFDEQCSWKFCNALLAGGKKGFGSEPQHRSLKVLRLMLPHVTSGGAVSACVAGDMHMSEQLAVRSAAERLCLWYRAHEITKGPLLAGYFETAFAYFLDFYGEKDAKSLQQEMQAAKFRPIPKPLPLSKSKQSAVTATQKATPALEDAESTAQSTAAKGVGRAGKPVTAHPASQDPSDGASRRPATAKPSRQSPVTNKHRSDETPVSTIAGAKTAAGGSGKPPSATSGAGAGAGAAERSRRGRQQTEDHPRQRLDVDLQNRPAPELAVQSPGTVVDIVAEKPATAPVSTAVGWVQLARGPAFKEVEEWLRTGKTPASARRPEQRMAAGLALAVAMPGAVAGRVGFDEWDVLSGPNMLAQYDNDAQDGAWWQRKYRKEEEADSLSEASESDNEPPDELMLDAKTVDRAREDALLEEEEEEEE